MPLEFDAKSHPIIRLSSPHSNLLLTSPVLTDGPAIVRALNSPLVYPHLVGPPYPFTLEDYTSSFPAKAAESAAALKEFNELLDPRNERKWVGKGCPCTAIREEGGEGRFLGNISCRLRGFEATGDEKEKIRQMEQNEQWAREGDERAEWEVGYWLVPEAHGKGIMAAALKVLIEDWMVPYMNVKRVRAAYLVNNGGSRRVLEKCGFVLEKEVPDCIELSEKKTGVKGLKVGLGLMVWEKGRDSVGGVEREKENC